MAHLEHLLSAFGPVVILLGAAFEGQTAVIAGGVLARQHLISPAMATVAAALGSGILDYCLFVLGRSFRQSRFVRRASTKPAFAKALGLIERFPSGFILSFRFLYGLRAAGPVAVGVTKIGAVQFAVLNAVGAAIWGGVFVGLGYAFGPTVMSLLSGLVAHLAPVGIGLAAAAAVLGLAVWRWRVWVGQSRALPAPPAEGQAAQAARLGAPPAP
jgi:membrane protein DedA with SNARE-associated domain